MKLVRRPDLSGAHHWTRRRKNNRPRPTHRAAIKIRLRIKRLRERLVSDQSSAIATSVRIGEGLYAVTRTPEGDAWIRAYRMYLRANRVISFYDKEIYAQEYAKLEEIA